MVNLFEAARSNGPRILSNYQSALASSVNREVVSAFSSWVEDYGRISINVGPFVLVRLLNGEQYQNTYEVVKELSTLCDRSTDDLLQERLKSFYTLRMAFDNFFHEGDKFYYGTLNAGGMGLSSYGSCCVILKWEAAKSTEEVAYLAGDSLKTCIGPQASFSASAINLFSPHSHRHYLVATEQASKIVNSNVADWPSLVCRDGCYFESIFVGQINLQSIDRVRIDRNVYQRLFQMAFWAIGDSRTPAERAEIYDFIELRKAEKNGRITVELL